MKGNLPLKHVLSVLGVRAAAIALEQTLAPHDLNRVCCLPDELSQHHGHLINVKVARRWDLNRNVVRLDRVDNAVLERVGFADVVWVFQDYCVRPWSCLSN